MKKILLLLLSTMLLISCTHFEVQNEIYPEITILGKSIGLRYKLGDLMISDTLKVSKKKVEFLRKIDNPKFTLQIVYNEGSNAYPVFKYYINGILFCENENTVSANLLLANMDKIDGFFLYKLDGKEISEMNEEEVKEKIEEIKESIPADEKWGNNKTKY
jgi:hypothetical protein